MIRILHVVSMMHVGGMESYIMNMYRKIDRSKVQFDFLVHYNERAAFEDEIEAMGGRIFRTTVLDDFNMVKYLRDLDKLFSEHPEFRIVHGHLNITAYWYLGAAKRHGVPWRIMHCHCPGKINSLKGNIKHLVSRLSPLNANIRLACSKEAGEYLFQKRPFEIIPNGIDVERFRFSEKVRGDVRTDLGLDDKFVIGHVGRFSREKNHEYMLEVFAGVKKQLPDAVLMLLGEGPLLESIQEKARAMGIADSVLFLGLIRDCAPYYQAMDAFIMPSLYEGLPLAGIEAQSAALPCLFTAVSSPEVKISSDAAFLPIGTEKVDLWVNALKKIAANRSDRRSITPDAGKYDSAVGTAKMVERYLNLWEKNL